MDQLYSYNQTNVHSHNGNNYYNNNQEYYPTGDSTSLSYSSCPLRSVPSPNHNRSYLYLPECEPGWDEEIETTPGQHELYLQQQEQEYQKKLHERLDAEADARAQYMGMTTLEEILQYRQFYRQERQKQQQQSNPYLFTPKFPPLPLHIKDSLVSMDCEMVGCGLDGRTSILARVVLVDSEGDVILDRYVRPTQTVTDYRTHVSGIMKEQLTRLGQPFHVVRANVKAAIESKILVGHGLENDLDVLRLNHPQHMIRDTATFEPYMKQIGTVCVPTSRVMADMATFTQQQKQWGQQQVGQQEQQQGGEELTQVLLLGPRKLRELTWDFLYREIQVPGRSHCPLEDAKAAMDLCKLMLPKWSLKVSDMLR